MTNIIDRKQNRAKLIAQAKNIIDTAESQSRNLSRSEDDQLDDLQTKIERATREIKQQERHEQLDRDNSPGGFAMHGGNDDEAQAFLQGETRSLTLNMSGAARDQRAGLTVGSPIGGGHTTPQNFIGQLYEHLTESSAIRRTNVTVHTTPDGRDLHIPRTTKHTTAEIVPEGADIPEDDPEFNEIVLGAFKYGRLIKLSNELISESGVNLQDYLARQAGRAIGSASGQHFITGTGNGQPEGVATAATVGITAAAPDSLTADELIEMYFSTIPDYRRNGYWMMNDVTWSKIRQLKDNTGRYLVGDLSSVGTPELLSRPVVIDPFMPAPSAGNKAVLFGDFSAYHIRQHQSIRFERSTEALFDSDQTVFRVLHRMDGKTVDTLGAIKALEMAA